MLLCARLFRRYRIQQNETGGALGDVPKGNWYGTMSSWLCETVLLPAS